MTTEKDSDVVYLKPFNLDMINPSTEGAFGEKKTGGSKIVIIGKPGCFVAGTKILKYDGSLVNVEDVKIGDKLMGDDSTVRNVEELCHNSDEMYKIVPNKGETYIVNKQHKLVLKSRGYNKIKNGEIIEITVENFLKLSKTAQSRWYIYRTDVKFDKKEVELDPYLLGLWLGDGTSCSTEFTTADEEIKMYLSEYCEKENLAFNKSSENATYQYKVTSNEKTKGKNMLLNKLRKYNVLNNKHIPLVYKANSREIRLQVLAGLLDTDGSYDERGCGFDFIQKNEVLFDDFIFLARSLGFSCTKKPVEKSCVYKGDIKTGNYFRCFVSGDVHEIPTKIKRKQARIRKMKKNPLVSGFKLEPQGYGEYFGFTLDGNHRFLLGSFDVVRNTGKSYTIASILYAKKHIFPTALVMSGTEDNNHFYEKFIPPSFIYGDYDEEVIEKFIKRQKIAKEHLPNPWAILLVDDCLDKPGIFNKPLQRQLFTQGRHFSMLYILSLQYALDVRPTIRVNIDVAFILREPSIKIRKSIWENYASVIPDFAVFCDIMDQMPAYTSLVIKNDATTNDWRDCVFYYKAPPTPKDFKFGAREYWDFHKSRFNFEYVNTY